MKIWKINLTQVRTTGTSCLNLSCGFYMWITFAWSLFLWNTLLRCLDDLCVEIRSFLLFNLNQNKLLLFGFSYSHLNDLTLNIFRWIFERFIGFPFDAIFFLWLHTPYTNIMCGLYWKKIRCLCQNQFINSTESINQINQKCLNYFKRKLYASNIK